jgi:hypothetical protein
MGVKGAPAELRTEPEEADSGLRWYHKIAAILFIVVSFELGVFLLVFPWMRHWEPNYFGTFSPEWYQIWRSAYFRGAVSGVGLVNIYIALVELFRLRRFGRPGPEQRME